MNEIKSLINESNGLVSDKNRVETVVSSDGPHSSAQKPVIQNISPLTITGVLSQSNQNSIEWSVRGFIAFGSHSRVVVVDTLKSLRICQSM